MSAVPEKDVNSDVNSQVRVREGISASDDAAAGSAAVVGGTAATWPTVTMTAVAGSAVKVEDAGSGLHVLVEHAFSAGDSIVVDFMAETVAVNGENASADVSVASDFFALEPGAHAMAFSGCSAHVVSWVERWA